MTAERYYVKRPTGKVFGPFDKNAIQLMLKSNKLGFDAQVSRDKEVWRALSEIPDFAHMGADLPRSSGGSDLPRPAGGGSDLPRSSSGQAGLPRSAAGAPALPRSAGGGSDLPRSSPGAADLPRPAGGSDLPRPAGAAGSGADLPRSVGDGGGAGLPRSAAGAPALPRSAGGANEAGSDLPRASSGQSGLPRSATGTNLPSPSNQGQDLPRSSGGADLPQSAGGADLPQSAGGAGLPQSAGGAGLPQSAGGAGLPRPSSPPNLPSSANAMDASGAEEDLFGGPMSMMEEEEEDLFGPPPAQDDEEDLFAIPVEDDDLSEEDLFGAPSGASGGGFDEEEEDLFGGPASGGFDDEEQDLFGGPASGGGFEEDPGEDLFEIERNAHADGGLDEDELFGAPAGAGEEDDLFGGPASGGGLGGGEDSLFDDAGDDDDFLGGDQGFSFLDDDRGVEEPSAQEDWEDDLLGGDPQADAGGGAEEDWEDDLLMGNASPGAGAASSSSGMRVDLDDLDDAPRGAPDPDSGDPFRPASRGIQQSASAGLEGAGAPQAQAQVTQEQASDEDKKRGKMALIGVPVVAVVVLGAVLFGVMKYLDGQEEGGPEQVQEVKAYELDYEQLYAANHAELRDIIARSKTAKVTPRIEGRLLLAEALMVALHGDEEAHKSGQARAKKLAGAKKEDARLGRGALAVASGELEAGAELLEPLAERGGEIGYFAHLFMGLGQVQAVEQSAEGVPEAAGRRPGPPAGGWRKRTRRRRRGGQPRQRRGARAGRRPRRGGPPPPRKTRRPRAARPRAHKAWRSRRARTWRRPPGTSRRTRATGWGGWPSGVARPSPRSRPTAPRSRRLRTSCRRTWRWGGCCMRAGISTTRRPTWSGSSTS